MGVNLDGVFFGIRACMPAMVRRGGGSIVATAQMSAPLRGITKVVVTQWSYAGLGAAIDMNKRIAESPNYAKVSSFGHHYFALSKSSTYLILAGFVMGFLLISAWLLRRHARS